MKRKLLSAALALVMCLCLLPGAALAAEGDELDLSNADTDKTGPGYSWTASSKTLTLDDGFRAAKVTLPRGTVTIKTNGMSTIGSLGTTESGVDPIELTFTGEGTLTVNQQINIAVSDYDTLTVSAEADVRANGGIYMGSGGANSTVYVYGKLIADGGVYNNAIQAGCLAVGGTGILEVSGNGGVSLGGMAGVKGNTAAAYSSLFTVEGNGLFTANCRAFNIQVESPGNLAEGTTAQAAIPLGPEYLPADCEVRLNEEHANQIDLVRISTGEIYKGAITIHLNHDWNRDSWEKDDTGHWHPCRFSGCDKQDSYAVHELDWQKGGSNHWQKCTVCGYETAQEAHSLSLKYDGAEHWRECGECGCKIEIAPHVYDDGDDASCNICGYTRTIDGGSSGGPIDGGFMGDYFSDWSSVST